MNALSAPECLALLEPASDGRALVKAALKELLLRRVFRLERSEARVLLAFKRRVRRLRRGGGRLPPQSPLLPFERLLAEAARKDDRLDRVLIAVRSRYGSGYARFRSEVVLAALKRRGLIEWRSERILLIIPRRVAVPSASGQAQRGELERLLREARHAAAKVGQEPAQLAALAASLGAAVVLVPELWPQLAEMDVLLRPPAPGSDGGSDPVFEFDLDFGGEEIDAVCSDVDGACDAADGGDGGDGGGDGGGD